MYAYVYTECIQYVLVLPCVCSVKVCVCVEGGGYCRVREEVGGGEIKGG